MDQDSASPKSPSSLSLSSSKTTMEDLVETIQSLHSRIEMLVGTTVTKQPRPTHEEEKKRKQAGLREFDVEHFLGFINSEEFDEIMNLKFRTFAPALVQLRYKQALCY